MTSNLSFAEATAELEAMVDPTEAKLKDLVARTRVTLAQGVEGALDRAGPVNATLLYSGRVKDAFHADGQPLTGGNIAKAMAQSNAGLAIIDNTHVGRLLESDLFGDKVALAGVSPATLFGAGGDFWASASRRFAAAATGDIVVLAPNPSALIPGRSIFDGIFSRDELMTLLEGSSTARINGISLVDLRERYSSNGGFSSDLNRQAEALVDVTKILAAKSMSDMWSTIKVKPGDPGGSVEVRVYEKLFSDLGIAGVGLIATTLTRRQRQAVSLCGRIAAKNARGGMAVQAEIKTGIRRIIQYLLSPIMKAADEAGRGR